MQRPFRIIGLDKTNPLYRGLITYVRFSQGEANDELAKDWALDPRHVSVNVQETLVDTVVGYRGSYALSPQDDRWSFVLRPSNLTPLAYTHLSVFRADTLPLSATWRQWRTGVSADTTGFLWDHSSGAFRQGGFHQESGGGYEAVQFQSDPPLNEWLWVVVRWDGIGLDLFVNGLLEDTNITDGTVAPFQAGDPCENLNSDGGHGWDWATLAIWERSLSDSEIWSLYDPATRWALELPVPMEALVAMGGGGPVGPTLPVLDEGHLTGGFQPLGGGMG